MTFEDLSDEELVHYAREGNEQAFSTLCNRHLELIHRVAYRLVGNMSDAEDVAQEVLLRAAKHIRTFRGNAKVTTWLYRITTNATCDFLRKEKRVERSKDAVKLELGEGLENQELISQKVREALAKLTPGERAAIVLTFYEGLNHAEAAKVLECAETTVSWRIFRSKQKLKKFLVEEEHDA